MYFKLQTDSDVTPRKEGRGQIRPLLQFTKRDGSDPWAGLPPQLLDILEGNDQFTCSMLSSSPCICA